MRRFTFAVGAVLALAVAASPADAQLRFGAHAALLTGLDEVTVAGTDFNTINGTTGLGGRVMLDPPLLPVALVGSGTYYLTDDSEPTYWTGTIAGQLRMPLPIVKPYATAGWQWRKSGADAGALAAGAGESGTETGPMLGIGVQLDFAVSLFLEGTFELNDDISVSGTAIDTNPIVIKGGILF